MHGSIFCLRARDGAIGAHAFKDCTGLTSIELPAGITSIGYGTFQNCNGLTNIEIPASVTYISQQAFYGCTNLTSVTFENPNGWYVATTYYTTSGTDVTLTDTATNVTYLKSTYSSYYWRRK